MITAATVVRAVLSALLVLGVYSETGFFTALVAFLFFAWVELQLQGWVFYLKDD